MYVLNPQKKNHVKQNGETKMRGEIEEVLVKVSFKSDFHGIKYNYEIPTRTVKIQLKVRQILTRFVKMSRGIKQKRSS